MGYKILVTGGAGFIGSNLTEALLNDDSVELVRVLDDLSNGYYDNIKEFEGHPKFEFIKGDICDFDTCMTACRGIDKISHQAALGSVPRSIENPIRSNEVNVGGSVNILFAAVKNNVERVVMAFSSSTYGDSKSLPKVEDVIGRPLSPYAVTKYADELYADVFSKTYNINYIGLRYFNVFGRKQNPNNPYAAVIPLFSKAYLEGKSPLINGDGKTSRDFTYIENAVHANKRALFTDNDAALNQVYNIAFGEQNTLLDLIRILKD
ncbi:MAG: NAD-dependent epimerase/dehydratase family protein, partial [Owenweeksia sp.]